MLLGTPIVRTDAAAIWATGQTWWQIPRVVKVVLDGKLDASLSGKDVIIALCALFNQDEVLNSAIEFCGDGVASLSIDDRLAISNMTTEWGSLAGVFPVDKTTIAFLEQLETSRSKRSKEPHAGPIPPSSSLERLMPDADAFYERQLYLNLSTLSESFVSGPNSVKTMTSVQTLHQQKIKV